MIALYPSYPTRPNIPDPAFGWEVQAAKAAGFKIAFVDLEVQFGGDIILRRMPQDDHDVVYRGWLLTPENYERLEETLNVTGYRMLEGVEAYRESYEFPRWYAKFKNWTPRSLVVEGQTFDLDDVAARVLATFSSRLNDLQRARVQEMNAYMQKAWAEHGPYLPTLSTEGHDLLELPGPRPIMVKDWVKSRKQDWFDACYMGDARDTEHVKKVVQRFIELNDGTLAGGLVFREFEDFKRIGTHPKTQMPVVNEWRGFIVNGRCCYLAPYWSAGDYQDVQRPTAEMFNDLAEDAHIDSPFYCIDVAETPEDGWRVIEINSGGASGVPEGGDITAFYQALAGSMPSS